MSATDKIKNEAEKVAGKAEQVKGHATGDPEDEREGRRKERSADLKQAGENVKDAF
jgi:uncharacterized protein YjbJ (UPF0337 family)